MNRVLTNWKGKILRQGVSLWMVALMSALTTVLSHLPETAENFLYYRWREASSVVDVVIGYKGSPVQILASSLYRMENPTGNLPEESAEFWQLHPMVAQSSRITLGDNWRGHPIVGTDSVYYRWFSMALVEGKWPSTPHEVVVPQNWTTEYQLKLGDELRSTHGSDVRGESHDHHGLTVVGFFNAPRPADATALFVNTSAYYHIHHSDNKDVTSILLKLKSKTAMLMLPRVLEGRANEQGAFPVFVFAQLQKQWQPLIDKWTEYGLFAVLGIVFLFTGFLFSLARRERIAVRVLTIKGTAKWIIAASVFGLEFLFAITGAVLGIWGISFMPGFTFQPIALTLSFVPILLFAFWVIPLNLRSK